MIFNGDGGADRFWTVVVSRLLVDMLCLLVASRSRRSVNYLSEKDERFILLKPFASKYASLKRGLCFTYAKSKGKVPRQTSSVHRAVSSGTTANGASA